MDGDIKNFLEKIRNSDEGTKKKWVIAASAVSMAIIVSFWLLLINTIVKPADEAVVAKDDNNDFWAIMRNGLAVAYQSITKEVGDMGKKINAGNSITIEK